MKKSKSFLTATLVSATILSAFALPSFASNGSASSKEISDYIPHIIIGSLVVIAAAIAAIVAVRYNKAKKAEEEAKAQGLASTKTQDPNVVTDDPFKTVPDQGSLNDKPSSEDAAAKTLEEPPIAESPETAEADETDKTEEPAKTETPDGDENPEPIAEAPAEASEPVTEEAVPTEEPTENGQAPESTDSTAKTLEEPPIAESPETAEADETDKTEEPAKTETPDGDENPEPIAEAPAEASEPVTEEAVPTEEPTENGQAPEPTESTAQTLEKPPITESPEKASAAETKTDDLKPGEFRDPETGCIYTYNAEGLPVAPDGMVIRYKWSFLGRLISADNTVKYRYMTLRRVFLSYKKVRSNVSWNFDSYFYGRKCLAKIKVRGKNLVVYFNIAPETMEGTKYLGKDVSSVSRYKTVPFAYQINGERKLHYAIELIRQLLDGVESEEPDFITPGQAQYAIPYEEFGDLFRKGYIKINSFLAVDRSTVVPADDDDDEPLSEEAEEDVSNDADTPATTEDVIPIEPEAFNFTPPKK